MNIEQIVQKWKFRRDKFYPGDFLTGNSAKSREGFSYSSYITYSAETCSKSSKNVLIFWTWTGWEHCLGVVYLENAIIKLPHKPT